MLRSERGQPAIGALWPFDAGAEVGDSSLLRTSRTVRSLSSDFTSVKYNLLCLLNTAVLAKFSEAGNITTYQVKKGLLTTYLVANGAKLARVLSAEILGLEELIGTEWAR
ncbi:hypothetical protein CH63R_09957 [Colletotrichum higginsianum IMI 349063]|uniref:Uncharacterized protein n=1 Tax=Colletotrichum higginsianum (strain IMI 349063) TaxID=759273 RepID=A0A1B7Y1I8_COLHI|nr:uncharacterized protein CH63R_09957 [Colletotrichum higginsianum IMI 349063]OBR05837.1 hypothetical protein CH63R_09957 [Colletotrichum higginsianum IMI 349063]